jgi:hypothetical protein
MDINIIPELNVLTALGLLILWDKENTPCVWLNPVKNGIYNISTEDVIQNLKNNKNMPKRVSYSGKTEQSIITCQQYEHNNKRTMKTCN